MDMRITISPGGLGDVVAKLVGTNRDPGDDPQRCEQADILLEAYDNRIVVASEGATDTPHDGGPGDGCDFARHYRLTRLDDDHINYVYRYNTTWLADTELSREQ
jgi:hypothetical protein